MLQYLCCLTLMKDNIYEVKRGNKLELKELRDQLKKKMK
jgi:hypothetical protein